MIVWQRQADFNNYGCPLSTVTSSVRYIYRSLLMVQVEQSFRCVCVFLVLSSFSARPHYEETHRRVVDLTDQVTPENELTPL